MSNEMITIGFLPLGIYQPLVRGLDILQVNPCKEAYSIGAFLESSYLLTPLYSTSSKIIPSCIYTTRDFSGLLLYC